MFLTHMPRGIKSIALNGEKSFDYSSDFVKLYTHLFQFF